MGNLLLENGGSLLLENGGDFLMEDGPDAPSSPSDAVGGDISQIETGPCAITYKSELCGHTIGGVSFGVKAQLRDRKVDEYGEHICDVLAQGDGVTIKTVLAEKTLNTVQTVYQYGASAGSNTWGFGRRPIGVKARNVAGPLTLHPLDAGESTADDVTFWLAAVSDSEEVQFGTINQDRVFGVTWTALPDESQSAGQLLGVIGVSGTGE